MKTVLVIEDEAQTRSIFLKCLAFEALGGRTGTEGIAIAKTQHPDLVVCDIMMPDIDGYAVLSALRQSQATAIIPLIFLTAKVTMADLRRGMELGADDYLTKPCTVEQFLAAISVRLRRKEELSRGDGEPHSALPKEGDRPRPAQERPPGDGCSRASIFPDCPQLSAVFHFIEHHYRQPINLSDVAQEAGYSPAYLTSLVQGLTGRSVKRWIIERRMAQARSLLIDTAQSVRQVAESSGYSDAGYFARQFRKFHGQSPKAWRQASVVKVTDQP